MRSPGNSARSLVEPLPIGVPPLSLLLAVDGEAKRTIHPSLPAGQRIEPHRPLRIGILQSDGSGPEATRDASLALTGLALALAEVGHEVSVLPVAGPVRDLDASQPEPASLREKGIHVLPIAHDAIPLESPWYTAQAYRTYQSLRGQDFDVLWFPEVHGPGFFCLAAKRQGLAFRNTLLCVAAQGPTLWRKADLEFVDRIEDLELDFLERQSVALADVLVSPSQFLVNWMEEQGWSLPERKYVQANPLAIPPGRPEPVRRYRAVREIVYSGAFDPERGLGLFCDALDRLAKATRCNFEITFLAGDICAREHVGRDYLRERGQDWSFPWRVLDADTLADVWSYLRHDSRVAVLPSVQANAPASVQHCLEAEVAFLASDAGATAELILPGDRQITLFPPRAEALAQRLADVLRRGIQPARPAVSSVSNRRTWQAWHAGLADEAPPDLSLESEETPLVSVCIPHRNRPQYLCQALASIEAQDYPNYEVVVVDDGSTEPDALAYLQELDATFAAKGWKLLRQNNRYGGAARNSAVRDARGEYILFMDDDNIARPEEIRTFVRVARRTGADILTAVFDVFAGNEPPGPSTIPLERRLPLGPAVAAGALNNTFGDMNALVRRDCFIALGGFSEDFGKGHEDWELFARAALQGHKLEAIPEPLFWYRVTEGSLTQSTPRAANFWRHLRPYLEVVPADLRPLLLYAQGMKSRLDALSREHGSTYTYAVNLERHYRNMQKWLEQLEAGHEGLKKTHAELARLYEEAKRWCGHLEGEYASLQGRHRALEQEHQAAMTLLGSLHHRIAEKANGWLLKTGPAYKIARKVLHKLRSR